jgi:hypothetical protein
MQVENRQAQLFRLPNLFFMRLCFLGSIYRALVLAAAAVNTGISVDFVLAVAFLDSSYRALSRAGSAHNAGIGNLKSHLCILLDKN